MAFQTPITIRKAITRIQTKEYVLPAIQREFVWPTRRIEWLFDSLMRDYPIGSFLFWNVQSESIRRYKFYDFMLRYHEKDNRHCAEAGLLPQDTVTAVLDGQQRLTALNIALRGSYAYKLPRLWWNNPDAFPIRHLCLNLFQNAKGNEQGMRYDFRFLTKEEAAIQDDSRCWYPVRNVLMADNTIALFKYLTKRLNHMTPEELDEPLANSRQTPRGRSRQTRHRVLRGDQSGHRSSPGRVHPHQQRRNDAESLRHVDEHCDGALEGRREKCDQRRGPANQRSPCRRVRLLAGFPPQGRVDACWHRERCVQGREFYDQEYQSPQRPMGPNHGLRLRRCQARKGLRLLAVNPDFTQCGPARGALPPFAWRAPHVEAGREENPGMADPISAQTRDLGQRSGHAARPTKDSDRRARSRRVSGCQDRRGDEQAGQEPDIHTGGVAGSGRVEGSRVRPALHPVPVRRHPAQPVSH